MQIERVGNPLERVAMDILGPLPETSRGNKYILVLGDYFTKWTEAYAMQNMEAVTVARIFVNEFVSRFGAPDSLHTDQGKNFDSMLLKEVCRLLGVEKTRTTPYHPQSDGLVERFNRTLLNMLSIIATEKEDGWDLQLPTAMLAYRTSIHETTKATPFSLMFGREARLPVDVVYGSPPDETFESPSEFALKLRDRLADAYKLVRNNTDVEQKRQKLLYDRRTQVSPYTVGDQVWLHSPAVRRGKSRKLH